MPLEAFFEFDVNSRTRGHTRKLKKNHFNRDVQQHFFTERIINDETVIAYSLNNFKWNFNRLRLKMGVFLD